MTDKLTHEQTQFLRQICDLQSDEWTEFVTMLLDIDGRKWAGSDEFAKSVEEELVRIWQWADENLKIIETTQTRTITETIVEVVERDWEDQ